ncbi:tetratricopeptide repeat protein, partial [Geitlerinema sp. CS-897]|nr:tetratricopeptide repeat protein [Geitlerinema sp. CS-897]
MKYFVRRAPDFYDWGSGVFEIPTDPKVIEQESLRVWREKDYEEFLEMTSEQRREKLIAVQTWLAECSETDRKCNLLLELAGFQCVDGKYENAIAALDEYLKLKPDKDDAWYCRGIVLDELGRTEEAIASYDRALEVKPDKDEAWNNRGLALRKLGRYEDAIASYDRALEVNPDDDEAWYNRGYALDELGRYEDAIASYDRALEVNPDDDEAWYNRGYALD